MRKNASNLENKTKRENSPFVNLQQQRQEDVASPTMVYTKDGEENGIYKNTLFGDEHMQINSHDINLKDFTGSTNRVSEP